MPPELIGCPALPAPPAELSEPMLYEFLLGEIALQRGDTGLAAQTYVDLAKRTRDPRIARRAVEVANGSRVITMIHRQEKRSLFGLSVARQIDLEDAQTIIAAIKETPPEIPIDMVLHTPGGLVLAAMQIARAAAQRVQAATQPVA